MAASLITFTGCPNAFLKSNLTHPGARLCGSWRIWPCSTAPGYPMETASYSHWAVSFLTWETICLAVISGPETNFCGVFSPEASIFTCVPPTSIANTFMHRHHIVFRGVQKQSALGGDPETLP